MKKRPQNVFIQGPISPQFVADAIAKHSSKTEIGAHDIFLGQVRADILNNKTVSAIEYTAYEALADDTLYQIREDAFAKFDITCLHIHHSLGRVPAGALCLFVFVSAPRRVAAFEACRYLVERIKAEAPIWGKEIFEDDSFVWKTNTNQP